MRASTLDSRAPRAVAAFAALLAAAVVTLPAGADALDLDDFGLGGLGMGHTAIVSGLVTSGTRRFVEPTFDKPHVEEGMGLVVRGELSALYRGSLGGHHGGLSLGMELGYMSNGLTTTGLMTWGMVMDMWMGFPIEAFTAGRDGFALRLFVEPGVGMGLIHLYAYIKAKVAWAAAGLDGEISWQWTPMEMSYAFSGHNDHSGINIAQARALVFLPGGKSGLHLFVDLTQSNHEKYGPADDLRGHAYGAYKERGDPLAPMVRVPFLDMWRVGAGLSW